MQNMWETSLKNRQDRLVYHRRKVLLNFRVVGLEPVCFLSDGLF